MPTAAEICAEKRAWPTLWLAVNAAWVIELASRRHAAAYRCAHCRAYHLTSRFWWETENMVCCSLVLPE